MPSGFDSAWCRVGPVRATPNEAVPLLAWAGSVTRPGSNFRSADRSAPRAGTSVLSPDGNTYHHPGARYRPQLPSAAPMCWPAPNPGKGPQW
jgi:hypothetical protein